MNELWKLRPFMHIIIVIIVIIIVAVVVLLLLLVLIVSMKNIKYFHNIKLTNFLENNNTTINETN